MLFSVAIFTFSALLCCVDNAASQSLYRGCAQRNAGTSQDPKIYCVCNSSYCDEIAPIGVLSDQQAVIYRTSRSGKRLERTEQAFQTDDGSFGDRRPIAVNGRFLRQTIIGFGGSFTDAAGIQLRGLSDSARENLLQTYFGPQGIGYTVCRVPIASCDFSTHPYSYAESDQDFQLVNFSLTVEDTSDKIPHVLRAMDISAGKLKLFASPWSAPAWMKTNGEMRGGGTLKPPYGGQYYAAFARYFIKFLEAYNAAGIRFWGLTTQNEPTVTDDINFPYQAMYWNSTMQRDFIANTLGPMLAAHPLGRDVLLMTLDDNRYALPDWADVVFASTQFSSYVAGIAVHWYANPGVPADVLDETHSRHPNKWLLNTEACTGWQSGEHVPFLGGWERADEYAHDIIEQLNHWVCGWVDWNMALDMQGGPNWVNNFVDGPILVNVTADEFYKNPMFYVLGHFSKFITPNSVNIRLILPSDETLLEGVAFTTREQLQVLVLYNRGNSMLPLAITEFFRPGQVLNVDLEAETIATLVWNRT